MLILLTIKVTFGTRNYIFVQYQSQGIASFHYYTMVSNDVW
jgi:hypothetical protein